MNRSRRKLMKKLQEMDHVTTRIEACRDQWRLLHQQYEAILNAAPDAMIFVDRNETIVLVNREAAALFGYSRDELTCRPLSDLIPERYRSAHHGQFQRFFGEGRSRRMGSGLPIFALRKDGTEFPVDVSLSIEELEDEALAVAAIRDMSAHKEATAKLELNFHVQRVISSVLRAAVTPMAMDELLALGLHEIISVPGLAFQSKGTIYLVEDEPEVLVMKAHRGASPAQLTSCVRVPFGKCLCGKAAKTGRIVFVDSLEDCHELQYEGIVSHGHYCVPIVWGEKTLGLISVAVNEGHKRSPVEEQFLVAVANTLAGVIERKGAEKALQLSEEKYRTLVENVSVGVYRSTGGEQGRFLQANPALVAMLGYDSVEELMQCPVADLYENPRERAQVVAEVLEKGFFKDRRLSLRKKDSSLIWASVTATAKLDERGNLQWLDGVVEDISERLAAEHEKQALLAQLTEAEKLAALGRLTQNIAHEIRNPLTAVGGFARRLTQGGIDTAKQQDYADSILSAVVRLENTLKNVLAFTREEKPQRIPCNLERVLDPVVAGQEKICREQGIEIQKRYTPVPDLIVDPIRIEEALRNLIANAVNAMPQGGILTIHMAEERFKEERYVVVRIGDTGEGMAPEKMDRIFEPFFAIREAEGGTDLGLPISKKIAEEHGGAVHVESQPGRGSVFSFYLPVESKPPTVVSDTA